MSRTEMDRLRADASGNTGLSAVLAQAVGDFSTAEDAVRFLASRGFGVTRADLSAAAEDSDAAAAEADGDGYGCLMRFLRRS
ncbi:hypothetical protein ACI7BZ_17275 [Xanthobacter sp. AM11]|uniref:hypothetical protein n=1 Tax=Xanthobacter sp. AM11 TaxID=3380643 RepID=UPI0039BFA9B5